MKAILLCGGHGTRLYPITTYLNKHLMPIYFPSGAVPVVEFAVRQLLSMNCRDIAVVLGDFRAEDIVVYFHKHIAPKYGISPTYYYQGEPLGIAHAVWVARDFIKDEKEFIVFLGDNCFFGEKPPAFKENGGNPRLCSVIFAETKDARRFGSPVFNYFNHGERRLTKILEKTECPQTNLALTGCYLFNSKFYLSVFPRLVPSKRGEYELSDVINYALDNYVDQVTWSEYEGFWSDAGTFLSIYELGRKLCELPQRWCLPDMR